MVTTDRLIPIDAFGKDAGSLVHLTGSFQVLGRVRMGDSDAVAAHVELLLDAAQVRGVGLVTGARYQARGAYRFVFDPKELPGPLDLVSTFDLLAYRPSDAQPTHLLLVVPFHVAVQLDGRITVGSDEPKLIPCP
jgi:hypothetical protein